MTRDDARDDDDDETRGDGDDDDERYDARRYAAIRAHGDTRVDDDDTHTHSRGARFAHDGCGVQRLVEF